MPNACTRKQASKSRGTVSHHSYIDLAESCRPKHFWPCRINMTSALFLLRTGEDEEKFNRFMRPMTTAFHSLERMLLNASSNSSEMNACAMRTLIGLSRDVRGLTYSFNTKTAYNMLFNVMYPSISRLQTRSAGAVTLLLGRPWRPLSASSGLTERGVADAVPSPRGGFCRLIPLNKAPSSLTKLKYETL